MTEFSAFLHPYGFLNDCITDSCKPWHSKWRYTKRSSGIFINCAATLPIIGQIAGIFMITVAIRDFRKSTDNFEKIESMSYLFRGFLTILGLGILCLFLDILVSCAILIKQFIVQNTNEFEKF